MRIDAMRTIDRTAGKPLCFAAGITAFLMRPFSRRRKPVRKILCIKLSELGAIICAYPLLKDLRRRFPGAELYFLTFAGNREVFRLLDGIVPETHILTLRHGSFPALSIDTLKSLAHLRAEGMDIVVDLEFFSRFTALITFATGAPVRAGFYRYAYEGLYRGELLTHKVAFNPLAHIIDTYRSFGLCLADGGKACPGFPRTFGEDADFPLYQSRDEAREKTIAVVAAAGVVPGTKLVLINPGEGTLPEREWPLEHFVELARRVLAVPGTAVVIVGTEGGRCKGEEMVSRLSNPRCVSLAGKTGLDELMELFTMASALVSNDCGLGHLAMLTACPSFILFGPESPVVFGPRGRRMRIFYSRWPCSPCLSVLNHRVSRCCDNKCLQAIGVEEVWLAVRETI